MSQKKISWSELCFLRTFNHVNLNNQCWWGLGLTLGMTPGKGRWFYKIFGALKMLEIDWWWLKSSLTIKSSKKKFPIFCVFTIFFEAHFFEAHFFWKFFTWSSKIYILSLESKFDKNALLEVSICSVKAFAEILVVSKI